MKQFLGLTLVLCLFTSVPAQDSSVIFDNRFTDVRELIIDQITTETVPSIVVAVAEDGKIIWEEAFGFADLENQIKSTPNTMYRLGSISKTITATGLMLLVEAGLIDLDKPANEYLPEDVRLRGFEGESGEITVRHLLNHRAGLPAYAEIFYEDDPGGRRSLAETTRRYGIIAYPPGWSFIYCNLGYQMAASMIAEVSGMSYAEFIEKRLYFPLGMTHSRVYEGKPFSEPKAIPYTPSLKRIPPYRSSYPGAEGNYASAHDLIRFAMFHLKDHLPDQEPILSDEAIDDMQAEVPPGNRKYGIGWDLDGTDHGYRSVYHGGDGPGANCMLRLFQDEDIAAVVLCNAKLDKLYDIQKAIFVALIPELGKPEPEPVQTEDSAPSQPPDEPIEMYRTWRGTITAYDREMDVELTVDSTGAKVTVGGQPSDDLEIYVLTPTFLLGMFDADIPTPDNERNPYRNRLAVVREGDRLYGAVISVGRRAEQEGHYELSSRIELRPSKQE